MHFYNPKIQTKIDFVSSKVSNFSPVLPFMKNTECDLSTEVYSMVQEQLSFECDFVGSKIAPHGKGSVIKHIYL